MVDHSLRPSIYRATPVFHFDASSTPSQANDTATAIKVKAIVMLGLINRHMSVGVRYFNVFKGTVPPFPIVGPCPNDKE